MPLARGSDSNGDGCPTVALPRTIPRPPRSVRLSGSGLEAREGSAAGVACGVAELFLDAQQLVVLRDPLGSCRCAGLDLTAARGYAASGGRTVLGCVRTGRGEQCAFVALR